MGYAGFSFQQLADADNAQVAVANLFQDATAAKVFAQYAGFWNVQANPPGTNGAHMGFNVSTDDASIGKTLDLGAKWVRMSYEGEWSTWKTYIPDAIKRIHAAGAKVLCCVLGVPGAALRAIPYNDTARKAYADFALFQADCGADMIEFWNEQNNSYFVNKMIDPAAYARMTTVAYPRVKATHPQLLCSTGGYSPAAAPYDCVNFDNACKQAVSDFDAHRDGVAHHPYDWKGYNPLTDSVQWSAFAQTLPLFQANPTKKVLITEIGSPSGGGSTHGETFTEARQAQWFDWYAQGIDAWPFKPVLEIWHTLFDSSVGISGLVTDPYFGIVHKDGSDKVVTPKFRARAATS